MDTELAGKRFELRQLAVVELDLEMRFEISSVGGHLGVALDLGTHDLHPFELESQAELGGALESVLDAGALAPRQHGLARVQAGVEHHMKKATAVHTCQGGQGLAIFAVEFDRQVHLLSDRVAGITLPPEEQAAFDRVLGFIARFKAADKVVLSAGMWNFGPPYRLKHLLDRRSSARIVPRPREIRARGLASPAT